MKRVSIYIAAVAALTWTSCHKHKQDPPAPGKATLSFPHQNEACLEGTVVSNDQSTVTFKWNASEHTDSYTLMLKNLLTQEVSAYTVTALEKSITLSRSTPYSWYVISKSSKTSTTTQSDTWKFYNSGAGQSSYAPFPAEATAPLSGDNVTATAGKVTLDWSGSDADNDIESYDVYLGTSATTALLKSGVTESQLSDVAVTSGSTYYWKIVSKDHKGNTSESTVFQFKVN